MHECSAPAEAEAAGTIQTCSRGEAFQALGTKPFLVPAKNPFTQVSHIAGNTGALRSTRTANRTRDLTAKTTVI